MTDRELMQQALSVLCNNVYPRDGVRDNRHLTPKSHAEIYQQTIDALRERLAQPEQEPVAWLYRDDWGVMKLSQTTPPPVGAFPVYSTPPQRKWVGLTDEEIHGQTILAGFNPEWNVEIGLVLSIVRNLEAKLKEKNGG
jgi:hypothetical protein